LGISSVNRLLAKLVIAGSAGGLLFFNPIVAQNAPPQKRAEHVKITKVPELEIAHDDLAIDRWTSTNPGGDDEHFAVIHYGTDPQDLSQTAKSPIRLNRTHPETIFGVRIDGLKPQTTYYYKSDLDGQRWSERRGGELGQSVHHTCPGSGNQRFPAAPVTTAWLRCRWLAGSSVFSALQ
jgi:Purple acid Phosphatase, N-terminal domain